MRLVQMRIARAIRLERLQTLPADMSLASQTRHMIASLRLLNRSLAPRTVLDSQLRLRFLQRCVSP